MVSEMDTKYWIDWISLFTEKLHCRVRTELWGYSDEENFSAGDLHKMKYSGIRPAFGYPSLPDPSEMVDAWRVMNVEKETGIVLTESYAMTPAASVSGIYLAHPQAKYFGVGKVTKEQVTDYAKRKRCAFNQAERWLAGNLSYDWKFDWIL